MADKFGLGLDEPESASQSQGTGPSLASMISTLPNPKPRPVVSIQQLDAAAAPHGFTSRENKVVQRRRIPGNEPSKHLAMRLKVSDYKRFQDYADENRLSYPEAFRKLMDAAGL